MSFDLPQPDDAAIRAALSAYLPHLASQAIEPLGEGWAFWAYRAGDLVLRFPRDPEFTETLSVEAAVMREMAPALPLPVSVIEVHASGPNGLPFTSHDLIRGAPIHSLGRPLAPKASADLGSFIQAMHAFPVKRAVELGLPYQSAQMKRERRRALFEERIVPLVFPLIGQRARDHVAGRFEAYLGDDANFRWQPVVSHGDIDDHNVLADPVTGELTGVADWGDVAIEDSAGDFTMALYGAFPAQGIELTSLLHACGVTEAELESMRPRCALSAYCWPLWEILYGLDSHQDVVVQKGVDFLYQTIKQPPS